MVTPTNFRFFPFQKTEFCDKSNGYPTMKHFKLVVYTQTAIAIASMLLSGMKYLQVQTSTIAFTSSALSFLYALVNLRLEFVLVKLDIQQQSMYCS